MTTHQSVIVKGLIYVFLVITVSGHLIAQQKLTANELSKIEGNFVENATARIKGQVFWQLEDFAAIWLQFGSHFEVFFGS